MGLEFVTGDAVFDGYVTVQISIPKSQSNWLYSVFLGALYNMCKVDSWLTGGETTPDEAAQLMVDVFDNRILPVLYDVGDIKWSGSNVAPGAAWLLCDGSMYTGTDYPDLFYAIGTNFSQPGDPSGTFRTPDLPGRTAVVVNNGTGRLPSWADTIGGVGGEASHILTVDELASHSHFQDPHNHTVTPHTHTYSQGLMAVTAAPPVVPDALTTNPLPGTTSSASDTLDDTIATNHDAGGDAAHNNVQPSIALYAYILASIDGG